MYMYTYAYTYIHIRIHIYVYLTSLTLSSEELLIINTKLGSEGMGKQTQEKII